MAGFRLPEGGRVDRAAPRSFSFNGQQFSALAGDTVASALLANGVQMMARSFKYHRPRGALSHGSDEPNALVWVDRGAGRVDPNNRATVVEVTEGLAVGSQNHWPSLHYDLGAANDLLSPLFAAGFYYKTFMWPRAFWSRLYEPAIRAAARLGKAPTAPDADRYTHRYAHCEVLIVGAGPAGLAAALAASQLDQRVIVVDEQAELGGALLHDVSATIAGKPAAAWVADAVAQLRRRANVTLLPRCTAFGYYNHNFVGLLERVSDHLVARNDTQPRERLWQVRAGRVILASGAIERPLVFPGNDRPGVMLADSVRAYINRYAVAPGKRIAFVTACASAYQGAIDAKAAGVEVQVFDVRALADCSADIARAERSGVRAEPAQAIVATRGRKSVTGLSVARVSNAGVVGEPRWVDCDCVGMSGGWTPTVHLFSQSRGKLQFDTGVGAFTPQQSKQGEQSVGAARGTYGLEACIAEGAAAGHGEKTAARSVCDAPAQKTRFAGLKGRAFVDFQNDVTTKDIELAVREGFQSVEHVKRYTTTGMATDQGKTSNMNALGLVAELLERPIADVGVTTFRPPYTPVSFGAIVGPGRGLLFDPIRETPTHQWAAAHGAVFEPVGLWRRAQYFPRTGEDAHAAVNRECLTVRGSVGMVDASTLGKIEVVGPDAAEFLNRIYVNGWSTLGVGKCRYGLMLKEDGYIFDDGVVARLANDRFHVTTTTGGAPHVLAHMEEYLQTEWPDLRVRLTSVSEQWAVISVQGPKARETIAPLVDDIDLSPTAFPHMSVRVGRIAGVPTRLFRVSFTGELGYEINVPTDYAPALWEALLESGARHGIAPYGTDALHVLCAERGFVIVGQETDGTVTPDDLGFGGTIARKKPDFVGKRSLARPDLVAAGRKQLVGLLTDDPRVVLEDGAQVVADPRQAVPIRMLGHVTAGYWSACLGRSIALALIADGRARIGETLHVTTPHGFTPVRVSAPVFYDPEGQRVHA